MNKLYTTLLLFNLLMSISGLAQEFTDISKNAGINFLPDRNFKGLSWGGIAVIDINNDGYDDLYLPGGSGDDALYKNNGDGTFTNIINTIGTKHITDKTVTLGAIAGDINNDGFSDLFITTFAPVDSSLVFSPNLLFLNNGNETFTDITYSSGIGLDSIFSGAASFGDINNDGYIDLFVSNLVSDRNIFNNQIWDVADLIWEMSPDHLYLNNRDNTFTEISKTLNLIDPGAGLACGFFDSNNDANIDLYTANDDFGTPRDTFPNKLFINQFPINNYIDIAQKANVDEKNTSMGIAFGDYDENGYLDFYITYCGRKSLYKNNSNNTFENKAYVAGVEDDDVPIDDNMNGFTNVEYTYTPYPGFVGGDTSKFSYCKVGTNDCWTYNLYVNVVDVHPDSTYYPWTTFKYDKFNAFLEVRKDKIANFCFPLDKRFELKFNNIPFKHGEEKIEVSKGKVPSTGWGANFLDYDNDGLLDLYVSNGNETPEGALYDNTNSLYKNIGKGRFTNVSNNSGANCPWPSRGSVILDYDNDGDVDIFVQNLPYSEENTITKLPHSILYQNNLEKTGYNNWIEMNLEGVQSNKKGIGAFITCYIGYRKLIKQVDGGSSHMSISSNTVHFGLGPYKKIDSILIVWPGGANQKLYNISINQKIKIKQECPITHYSYYFNQVDDPILIHYTKDNPNIKFSFINKISTELSLDIYNIKGDKLITLYSGNGKQLKGKPISFDTKNIPNGFYYYELKINNKTYRNIVNILN